MEINQDLCSQALLFACINHDEQKMASPKVTYVAHITAVAMEAVTGILNGGMENDFNLENIIITAYLHDTIEDTEGTYDQIKTRFGKVIADGVLALTKDSKLKKEDQMKDSIRRIKQQPKEVWVVKLADRIFNLRNKVPTWTEEKIEQYEKEARLILNELGSACPYLAKRLEKKIAEY